VSAPGTDTPRERRGRTGEAQPPPSWTRPGTLIFLAAAVLAAAGWVLIVRASLTIPVHSATFDGLSMELLEARWVLDQMDHGENFQKPSVMMPDMPEWGSQRVTLDLSLRNGTDDPRWFRGEELWLVPEIGEEVPPYGALTGTAELLPGQRLNTAVHFDFDVNQPHGRLRVEWRRGDQIATFAIPEPAEHYHLRPRGGELDLPPDARLLLPIGKPGRGAQLFSGVYGCAACHGDPARPGSNNVGPHLGTIGADAGGRIAGVLAEQYIYDSILRPGSFIAPECRDGAPCAEPTAMPEYASLVTLQDVADLVTFLLEQRG